MRMSDTKLGDEGGNKRLDDFVPNKKDEINQSTTVEHGRLTWVTVAISDRNVKMHVKDGVGGEN